MQQKHTKECQTCHWYFDIHDINQNTCDTCTSKKQTYKLKTKWAGINKYFEQCKRSEERAKK